MPIDLYQSDTPAPEAGAVPDSSADLDAQLDEVVSDLFGTAPSPDDAATPPPADEPAPTETGGPTETTAAPAAPVMTTAERAAVARAEQAEKERDEATANAHKWNEWHQGQERVAAARQSQADYEGALAGARKGKNASRDEVRQLAQDIYDPDKRQEWVDAKDDEIDEWYSHEIGRINDVRVNLVAQAARQTVAQMGRPHFVNSLISAPDSGLTAADLPIIAAQPDGRAMVAKAAELKRERDIAALRTEVTRLTALQARGQLAGSAASLAPGTGTRGAARPQFAKYDDAELDAGLDDYLAALG